MKNLDAEEIRLEVKWRGGFADRNKYYPINTNMQLESLDDRVRTRIYNYFIEYIESITRQQDKKLVINFFLQEFYLTDFNCELNYYNSIRIFNEAINDTLYKEHWSKVFSFIEFWTSFLKIIEPYKYDDFKERINNILEKEYVGYRLIDELIVPTTNELEIKSIEETSNIPYNQVKIHIKKALEKLSHRENPDYENSIKESISSVESMAKIITANNKATLGEALKKLEDVGTSIHPALKDAFLKLYGYTSDESGIRHSSKIGGIDSTFEEAKFMLVACAAFNNYLMSNLK